MSASRGTILVIDDEDAVQRLVRFPLEREGYRVLGATSGEDGLRLVEAERPDLVLLDLMLPGMDGIEVCRRLRVLSATLPIIMLTARDDEVDKVVGLEIGADDYVTKPVEPRELLARIKARLRPRARDRVAPPRMVERCGVRVDLEAREVTFEGRTIPMTRMEFGLLVLLLEHPGRVFSREELLNRVWGYERTPTTRTVDTHVVQLRTKLRPDLIESVRGIGYRLVRDLTEDRA